MHNQVKKIVSKCDIGICSLSLHFNKMNEASPLKSRQYLAQGLPIIYAYNDTDFSGDEEFTLQIPNTLSNIEDKIDEIKKFIVKCHGNSELRLKAREFALNHLDVSIKEKKRIEFFKKVLAQES